MTDISVSIVAYRNYDDIKAAVESIEKYTDKAELLNAVADVDALIIRDRKSVV